MLVFQVICIFCLHRALHKIHTWKLFALNLVYGEIKNRKKSLGKEKEKTCLKNTETSSFCPEKKKILAESDKGSWFGQEPSTSSASAEALQHLILGASGLKIKIIASEGCQQHSSSESDGTDGEEE